MKMKSVITVFAVVAMTTAIDVKFDDIFGGMHKISIPACKAEPCNIVQGVPLVTYLTFAAESPKYPQGKTFKIFTTGYLSTFMDGYGNKFGTGLLMKLTSLNTIRLSLSNRSKCQQLQCRW